MSGGAEPGDRREKGRACQLECYSFTPLNVSVVDVVFIEESEDVSRDAVGRVGRNVQGGIDRYPHPGGTEGLLVVGLSVWGGEEASGVNRVALVYGSKD